MKLSDAGRAPRRFGVLLSAALLVGVACSGSAAEEVGIARSETATSMTARAASPNTTLDDDMRSAQPNSTSSTTRTMTESDTTAGSTTTEIAAVDGAPPDAISPGSGAADPMRESDSDSAHDAGEPETVGGDVAAEVKVSSVLPTAPFSGIVRTYWGPELPSDAPGPRAQFFDTSQFDITEIEIRSDERGPLVVELCYMWPVVTPERIEFWFRAYQRVEGELAAYGRGLATASWGESLAVSRSDRSDWGFTDDSFPTAVAYGDSLIELVEFNGGFTLRFGDTNSSYQIYPPAEEGSEREYFGAPWAVWLVGTDGAHLGIEMAPADSCLGPVHFFLISLLDGSVRSCTVSLGRFQLVTTASPDDSESWLENPRFPADDSLNRDDCEPFDSDYSLWSTR